MRKRNKTIAACPCRQKKASAPDLLGADWSGRQLCLERSDLERSDHLLLVSFCHLTWLLIIVKFRTCAFEMKSEETDELSSCQAQTSETLCSPSVLLLPSCHVAPAAGPGLGPASSLELWGLQMLRGGQARAKLGLVVC